MQTFMASDKRRMYGDLAWTWPIISPHEDYREVVEEIAKLLTARAGYLIHDILHLGCGGGNVDHTLKQYFSVTGVDISEEMLSLARQLNPDLTYQTGDMRSVRLGKQFDAVILLDSIGYMRTVDSLRAAFKTASAHLIPGGVLLALVEETRESFVQNRTVSSAHSRGEIEIVLVENYYDPDPEDSSYEANFVYLIRRSGELTVETDCHLLGLFELEIWTTIMRELGCDLHQTKSRVMDVDGRTSLILIGTKKY